MKMIEWAFSILLQIVVADSFSPSSVNCLVGSNIVNKGVKSLCSVANPVVVNGGEKQKEKDQSDPFSSFDYESHWYPVSWEKDLIENEPTKVTVFDVDYVIAKTSEGIICLEDKCTHKSAALSDGRVSSNGKNFQCAYHGWSFDGKSGECVEIPQLVRNDGSMGIVPSRSCAKAVPAQIHEEMVWIFP